MKKILFTVLDGLGDKPVEGLGNQTPLGAGKTPNLDAMAGKGVCGLVTPVYTGAIPTSEEGHFALFGYNPHKNQIKRGFFTAKGTGLEVEKGDVALRGNFATVDENMNLLDRRAGRIKDPSPLVERVKETEIEGVKFLVRRGPEHRVGILLKGEGLSPAISDSDPFYSYLSKELREVQPLEDSSEAKFTAKVLNQFLKKAHKTIKDHPLNKKREKEGKFPANYIITRGASTYQNIPEFKEKYGLKASCIAGKLLYKQIGEFLGMDIIEVRGANGLPTTNLEGKFSCAREALKENDFVFLHIKATDSLAEDGACGEKKQFIEKVDAHFGDVKDLEDTLIVVTGDHSTCCELERHCREPFPLVVYGNGSDGVAEFSEAQCGGGEIGKIEATEVLEKVFEYAQ